jgi:hypothetical protein
LPEIRGLPDTGKRYIALFDGFGLRLPVKRVIVGPGARTEERGEGAVAARRSPGHDFAPSLKRTRPQPCADKAAVAGVPPYPESHV